MVQDLGVYEGFEGPTPTSSEVTTGPRVVLCGSYRRDAEGLRGSYETLARAGCDVLSPRDIVFVGDRDGFVLAAAELEREPAEVEAGHLAALMSADFVWLHAPDGYVGLSGSLEVGFANAIGVPVYSSVAPKDLTIRSMVEVVDDVAEAVELVVATRRTPSNGLRPLQEYYERVATARGYDKESPAECMLLLTEEVGELARAVRKSIGLVRHGGYSGRESVEAELADVQLYILHLANVFGVDLSRAVQIKEQVNAAKLRRGQRENAAAQA